METKANLENMQRCPRFISCSIPKCPLDEFMNQRSELPEDEVCPLRRLSEAYPRRGKIKVVLSAKMKTLLEFVPAKNKRMAKMA
jgi:hypothetical protein